MFEEGDLFFLNERGKILFQYIQGENGIIIEGPYLLYEYDFHATPEKIEYNGYDILIKGRLFKEIPEKFLIRVTKNN
tara:strand:+ start:297 stop:527 length:231 start_codon:yes stop_codon:yes gene_type:complete